MRLKSGKHRLDLYLDEKADARLIEYLQPFVDSRRLNEELRRLLYAAMDGRSVASTPRYVPPMQQAQPFQASSAEQPAATQSSNVKSKLKRAFGTAD